MEAVFHSWAECSKRIDGVNAEVASLEEIRNLIHKVCIKSVDKETGIVDAIDEWELEFVGKGYCLIHSSSSCSETFCVMSEREGVIFKNRRLKTVLHWMELNV